MEHVLYLAITGRYVSVCVRHFLPVTWPPDAGRGVGKESEYLGGGGGEPRLICPGTPSGVLRIFGRALNADMESVTLQSTKPMQDDFHFYEYVHSWTADSR